MDEARECIISLGDWAFMCKDCKVEFKTNVQESEERPFLGGRIDIEKPVEPLELTVKIQCLQEYWLILKEKGLDHYSVRELLDKAHKN